MKTILVVEDDEGNGLLIARLIAQETLHQAVVVRDCREALLVTSTMKPELFIVDYRLPTRNGFEVYDALHAQKELQHIPAIIISATHSHEIARQVEERNLIALDKPFELDEFIATIEKVLSKPATARECVEHALPEQKCHETNALALLCPHCPYAFMCWDLVPDHSFKGPSLTMTGNTAMTKN